MKKAGGIIALIAGILGIFAAGATLLVGGIGGAFEATGASTVVNLGWGGVIFSFIVIILGALVIGAKSKVPGILLIVNSIAGAILGGTLVAVFMLLSLVGGILAVVGTKKALMAPPPLPQTDESSTTRPAPPRKMNSALKTVLWIVGASVVLVILVAVLSPTNNKGARSQSIASTSSNATKVKGTPAQKPAPPLLKVGDTFRTPTFQIQIVSARLRSSVGNSFYASKVSHGGIYLAILWTYKNISQKPVSPFNLPTLRLVASNGTRYDPDLGASASYAAELNTDEKVLSDLNPGIQVTDADVFEVSKHQFNPATWKIAVDADVNAEVEFSVSNSSDSTQVTHSSAANNVNTASESTSSSQTGIPPFQNGEPYTDVRTELLAAGWQPFHSSSAETCEDGDPRCQGRPEMYSCAGTGLANCKFLWKKQDKTLAVCTVGEEIAVFDTICQYP